LAQAFAARQRTSSIPHHATDSDGMAASGVSEAKDGSQPFSLVGVA
jgi:hypothetical protein